MIIDCISDTHGFFPQLEGGDLLIVAGDLTAHDAVEEYSEFQRWFVKQRYRKKILIAGNHDTKLEGPWPGGLKGPFREDKAFYDFDYLCDSGTTFEYDITIEGHETTQTLKIWGSPWTPLFDGVNPLCTAFTLPEAELEAKFALIPDDTDILITHGPAWGILDENYKGAHGGSKNLQDAISRIQQKLHVFGHIHEAHGKISEVFLRPSPKHKVKRPYIAVNSSYVNEHYKPVNKPVRVIL